MSLTEIIKEKAKEQRDELQKHLLWDLPKKHSSVDGNVAQRCISELEDEVLKILEGGLFIPYNITDMKAFQTILQSAANHKNLVVVEKQKLQEKYRKLCETRIQNIADDAVAFFIEELTGLEPNELLSVEFMKDTKKREN